MSRTTPLTPQQEQLIDALLPKAHALLDQGEFSLAQDAYQSILDAHPTNAEALYGMGLLAQKLGRLDIAADMIGKSLAQSGDSAVRHCVLADILAKGAEHTKAIEHYQKAIALDPHFFEALSNLGHVYSHLDRTEDAHASFQKAVELRPDVAEAHSNLANVLRMLGRIGEAQDACRKVIALKPHLGEVHLQLAGLKTFRDRDKDMELMLNLFADPTVPDPDRMFIGVALGKAFHDLKDHKQAFSYLSTSNALKRKTFSYCVKDSQTYFDNLKAVFTRDFMDRHVQAGLSDVAPVFIVGMPRSATTLSEHILASHPHVFGAGELPTLRELIVEHFGAPVHADFPKHFSRASDEVLHAMAQAYGDRSRNLSDGEPVIIDKMPHNFEFLPLIKTLFPQAKIVHCKRDRMDTCLSIFRTYFTANYHRYAYDLNELGQYYRLYEDLMAHWEDLLGDAIFTVHYEDLIADQRGQTQALLDHLGLPWDDACLNFHALDRTVKTASSSQVRKPLYKSSVKSWTRYGSHLDPLKQALGYDEAKTP